MLMNHHVEEGNFPPEKKDLIKNYLSNIKNSTQSKINKKKSTA